MKTLSLALTGLLALGGMQAARADAGGGALAGALIGGIIGHQSHETGAGIAIGALAGAAIGDAADHNHYHRSHTVVTYRGGYYGRGYDSWGCGVGYSYHPYYRPEPRVVYVPAPAPREVVVVQSAPTVANASTVIGGEQGADESGYTSAQYLALLTPQEMDILRQRSYGKPNMDLTDFLTAQEKGNLRARAANQVVIGQ